MRQIIAIGLLTQSDIELLGGRMVQMWPIDETPCFAGLLQAIDEAERRCWRRRDAGERVPSPRGRQDGRRS